MRACGYYTRSSVCVSLILILSQYIHSGSAENNTDVDYSSLRTVPPSYFNTPMETRILIEGATYVQKSQPSPFIGYISKLGDTVTITCHLKDSDIDHLVIVRYSDGIGSSLQSRVQPDARISQVRDGDWLNTTINGVTLNDTGKYVCYNDFKHFVVIDPDKPATVTKHQCTSDGFNDLVCEFHTNSSKYDLMDWKVQWSTDEPRMCVDGSLCRNMQCTETNKENLLYISPISAENPFQRIKCTIKGFLFVGVKYNFAIKGNNSISHSESTVSVLFDTSIVVLQPPQLIRVYPPSADTISMELKLNEHHLSSSLLSNQLVTHIELDIKKSGLRYRIQYSENDCDVNQECLRTKDYEVHSIATTLSIGPLLPFTIYVVSVQYQMADTINDNVWSSSVSFKNRTSERAPWNGPEISSVGYELADDELFKCKEGRSVTLYWKALPEIAYYGNGKITEYSIYNLGESVTQIDDELMKLQYDNAVHLTSVDGSRTSASVCLDERSHRIGVIALNSAGNGPVTKEVIIPAVDSVLSMSACEFSVSSDGKVLTVTLPTPADDTKRKANFTVFMCKRDDILGSGCEFNTIKWYNIKPNLTQFEIPYKLEYIGYNFGLAKTETAQKSSGVIWSKCIDDLTAELRPSSTDIQIDKLRATVEIQDNCGANSRLPERRILHYCLYDYSADQCTEKESVIEVPKCEKYVSVQLSKNNQEYGFWVETIAGTETVISKRRVKVTAVRELEKWEIALIVIVTVAFIIGISLLSVFLHKQLIKMKAFQRPTIVLPDIEEEMFDDESNGNDQNSLLEEYISINNRGNRNGDAEDAEEVPMSNMTVATSLIENDWLDMDRSMSDYYRMGARPRVRPDTNNTDQSSCTETDPSLPTTNDDKLSGYSKIAPSISSYRQLPEEYLQCTAVDPGFNFSGGSFYNDTSSSSDNNVIDITKYLLDTSQPNSKLTVDLPSTSQYPQDAANYTAYPSEGQAQPNTNTTAEDYKGLHVDLPESSIRVADSQREAAVSQMAPASSDSSSGYSALSIPSVLSSQSTATGGQPEDPSPSYIQAIPEEEEEDAASDTSSLTSRPISISSSLEISGGTSGDSGFNDGRNTSNTSKLKKCSDYKNPDSNNAPSRDHSGNQAPPV